MDFLYTYLPIKGYLAIGYVFIGRYAITIAREKEHALGKKVEYGGKGQEKRLHTL